jgi:hypothetical protein
MKEAQHPKLTRAQRRRMRKLAERVDLNSEADRKYFERFHERTHRVRVAGLAEIEQNRILRGGSMSAPPDRQFYTVVRNVRPGVRLRMAVQGPANADPELFGDAKARAIYAFHETEECRALEAQMIELFEAL